MPNKMDIRDLEDAFVLCRTLGHAWEDNPHVTVDSTWFRTAKGVLTLRCHRCGTERIDYLSQAMEVVSRMYRYPDNYTTIVGQGSRPNLRGEMLRRSLLIHTRRNGRKP